MPETIICPECGNKVAKGSTHCLHCGTRLDPGAETTVVDYTPSSASMDEDRSLESLEMTMTGMLSEGEATGSIPDTDSDLDSLPPIDEDLLPEPTLEPPTEKSSTEPSPDELVWDVGEDEWTGSSEHGTTVTREIDTGDVIAVEAEVTREIEADEVTEGDPFKEVAPPIVRDSDDMVPTVVRDIEPTEIGEIAPLREIAPAPEDAKTHLFTDEDPSTTAKAVTHLFPEGKGTTSKEFIDIVVGKPKRIVVEEPMHELDTPMCPSCGEIVTGDDFKYPDYVYEAMARARMEYGLTLLKRGEHEKAIESFEKAKLLYERAGDKKGLEEATRKVDEGYESMAESHFVEGEQHFKQKEFEWAIVQFRKARELYMFTALAKMRAKCSEKIRKTYEEWGKMIEEEADDLSKIGDSRRALALYQEAAEKYRLADAPKRLKNLEKKILRA